MAPIAVLGKEVIARLAAERVVGRLFGGAAIVTRALWDRPFLTCRITQDIDVAVRVDNRVRFMRALANIVTDLESRTWLLSEGRFVRGYISGVKVDFFSDPLEFNQRIRLGERLNNESTCLCDADLLITKLQIDAPKKSDTMDAAALLLAIYAVGRTDTSHQEEIIAQQCEQNWRLFQAVQRQLKEIPAIIGQVMGEGDCSANVATACAALLSRLRRLRVSWKWRTRALVGNALPRARYVDEW